MADTTETSEVQTDSPDESVDTSSEQSDTGTSETGTDLGAQLEHWKTEAKKQEGRAKANVKAADQLPVLTKQVEDLTKQLEDASAAAESTFTGARSALIERLGIGEKQAALITGTDLDTVLTQIDAVLDMSTTNQRAPKGSAPLAGTGSGTGSTGSAAEFARAVFASGDD